MEYLIFFLMAAVALWGALNVVLRKNPVIGALNLILTILTLAGLYMTLDAEFLAAVQIIVYAGAIMVLFLFVVLLINLERGLWEEFSLFRLPTPILGLLFTLALVLLVWNADVFAPEGPETAGIPIPESARAAAGGAAADAGSGKEVGKLLFTEYAFPFEIASVILFAGMIGAIVLAKKRRVQ